MRKKTEVTLICLFVTSGFRTNKRRKRDTSVFIFNKRKRERERETHARAHHHSRFSIIIVSDLYQRDREKEWLRERFE